MEQVEISGSDITASTNSNRRSSGLVDERALANFILDFARESSTPITHMQIQKILYFCHGWHLARTSTPLIKGRFEAWREGPVLRSVYNEFKSAGAKAILTRASVLDIQNGYRITAVAELSKELGDFVRTIARLYMGHSAYDLSDLTHAVGSPWHEVAFASHGKVNLGLVISNDAIASYFASGRAPLPRG